MARVHCLWETLTTIFSSSSRPSVFTESWGSISVKACSSSLKRKRVLALSTPKRFATSSRYPSIQLSLLMAMITFSPPFGLMNFKEIASFSSMLCFLFCSAATLATLLATLRRFSLLTASLLSSSSFLWRIFCNLTSSCAARSAAAAPSAASVGVDTSMTSLSPMPNAAAVLMGSSSFPACVKVAEESFRPNFAVTACIRTCSRLALRKLNGSSGPYTGRTVRFKRSPYFVRSPCAGASSPSTSRAAASSALASREPSRTSAAACTRAESSRAQAAGASASKAMEIRRCIGAKNRTKYQIWQDPDDVEPATA
mmetsp:Transcript_43006/g.133832  ORF Transcript_43006/g.133832 Transcript_43006/m.133832 type:complete len:312 (-) Transcript_43006:7-942(-)